MNHFVPNDDGLSLSSICVKNEQILCMYQYLEVVETCQIFVAVLPHCYITVHTN